MLDAIDLTVLAACTLALAGGGMIKGATGLGLPLFAIPVLASFIPLPQALALLAAPSLASSLWQALSGGMFVATTRRLAPLLIGTAAGVALGAGALVAVDPRTLYLALGCIILGYATLFFLPLTLTIPPRHERWGGAATGVLAGIIGGGSMLFGPLFAMYLGGLRLNKDVFVAAVSVANVFATVYVAAALTGYRLIGATELLLSLAAAIPVFAGLALGQRLRRRLNEGSFRRLLALVLLLMGLNLLRRALA